MQVFREIVLRFKFSNKFDIDGLPFVVARNLNTIIICRLLLYKSSSRKTIVQWAIVSKSTAVTNKMVIFDGRQFVLTAQLSGTFKNLFFAYSIFIVKCYVSFKELA